MPDHFEDRLQAAVGVRAESASPGVITDAALYEVALTDANQNANHPDWTQPT